MRLTDITTIGKEKASEITFLVPEKEPQWKFSRSELA